MLSWPFSLRHGRKWGTKEHLIPDSVASIEGGMRFRAEDRAVSGPFKVEHPQLFAFPRNLPRATITSQVDTSVIPAAKNAMKPMFG